jgi:hypothetical protein
MKNYLTRQELTDKVGRLEQRKLILKQKLRDKEAQNLNLMTNIEAITNILEEYNEICKQYALVRDFVIENEHTEVNDFINSL